MGEALKLRPLENVKENNDLVFGILYKRLLQNDCLRNGWVLYGYPCDVEHIRYFYEASEIQPNKVFFYIVEKKWLEGE